MLENTQENRSKIVNKLTKEEMANLQKQIYYSDKYTDDEYEYRKALDALECQKLATCHAAQRDYKTGAKIPFHDRDRMAQYWSTAKSWLGTLHEA